MKYNYEYISRKIEPIDDNQSGVEWAIDESDDLNANECGGEVIEIDFRAHSLLKATDIHMKRRQIIQDSMLRHPSNFKPD